MSLTAPGFVPYEMKTSVIRVYGYEGKQLQGELNNPYYSDGVYFDNALQLLFLLENLSDDLSYPQKGMEDRNFVNGFAGKWQPQMLADRKNDLSDKTTLATFSLRILFRQNASWQGILGWKEAKSEAQFRSVWELLKLIDNVLTVQLAK